MPRLYREFVVAVFMKTSKKLYLVISVIVISLVIFSFIWQISHGICPVP